MQHLREFLEKEEEVKKKEKLLTIRLIEPMAMMQFLTVATNYLVEKNLREERVAAAMIRKIEGGR